MLDRIRELAARGGIVEGNGKPEQNPTFTSLRAVTAQLLLATAAGATLEQVKHYREEIDPNDSRVPGPLTWAPLIIGPLTAAATFEHARRPTERTATAVRFLTAATIGLGGSLFAIDAIVNRDRPPTRLGPLAFASAGLLGLLVERQERESASAEKSLRRRARVVERFVPARKAKVDRIVVHI